MTPILTWKTHNGGKNHGSPQTAEYTMRETITTMEAQGQRPLALPLFATLGGYNRGNYLSLSLSRSVQLTLYKNNNNNLNNISKVCALSHISTYMTFGLFTQMSTPIGRTDRNRFLDQPVLCVIHPEGHVSQQTPPSLRHGMSLQSDLLLTRSQLVGCQHLGQHV